MPKFRVTVTARRKSWRGPDRWERDGTLPQPLRVYFDNARDMEDFMDRIHRMVVKVGGKFHLRPPTV